MSIVAVGVVRGIDLEVIEGERFGVLSDIVGKMRIYLKRHLLRKSFPEYSRNDPSIFWRYRFFFDDRGHDDEVGPTFFVRSGFLVEQVGFFQKVLLKSINDRARGGS